MKKLSLFLVLATVLIASSCSGVKVTDSWKADGIGDLTNEKILVIARTDDNVGRQRFEQEIASRLRENGFSDVTESYMKFPSTPHNKKRTKEETDKVISIIQAEGFNIVVLTVLRDKSSELVTSQTGGYTTGGVYGGMGYGMGGMGYGGYYGGMGGYYGSVYSPYGYGYGGAYVPSETRTYTSDTYALETVAYDLRKDKDKQLLGVVSVDVTDPKSVSKIAPQYAEAVTKNMKKTKGTKSKKSTKK